jgi:peptidyl-tRNA hydrolase
MNRLRVRRFPLPGAQGKDNGRKSLFAIFKTRFHAVKIGVSEFPRFSQNVVKYPIMALPSSNYYW